MKNIILTILFITFLGGLCAAQIFGQNSQNPTVDKSKLAVNRISDDEKPLRTFKIRSQKTGVKPVEVKVFAGLVKGLKVVNTYWDDAKKVLTVEVENKNTAAASSKALLNLSIQVAAVLPEITSQTKLPNGKAIENGKAVIKTITVYSKYLLVKELDPQTKTIVEYDFADFKAEWGNTKTILENLADDEKREKQIWLKIYEAEAGK